MKKHYSGFATDEETALERENRLIALHAAIEGIVLLENDGCLPLNKNLPVALYGSGVTEMIKGGTGSGDVNERHIINIEEGFHMDGFTIENSEWLQNYEKDYQAARKQWKDSIQSVSDKAPGDLNVLINAYMSTPFIRPVGSLPVFDTNYCGKSALFVLSRQAGEGADRKNERGDYLPSEEELTFLKLLRAHYESLILVINCGSQIDLNEIREIGMNAIIQLCQPGMMGGLALAKIISGEETPSAKLTATWARHFEDYPSSEGFAASPDQKEYYREGIYVGYRYFDTFDVKPLYSFGHGLSYTTFELNLLSFNVIYKDQCQPTLSLKVSVKNTGALYSGKEVVQIYTACPSGTLKKETKRLSAFAKTPLLAPGENVNMEISFSAELLSSYSEKDHAYLLEKGMYTILLGSSSGNAVPAASFTLDETVHLLTVENKCTLKEPLKTIEAPDHAQAIAMTDHHAVLTSADFISRQVRYDTEPSLETGISEIVDQLNDEQLTLLANGDPRQGQDTGETFGDSGKSVPGAAGETSSCAPDLLDSLVLADGPAGVRLAQQYQVKADGSIHKPTFFESIERGLFSRFKPLPGEQTYYQFCTAFPVGTMIAQSWNRDLAEEFGRAVAKEMSVFGVTLWLAPGMNIHRNPLCGRNFEYFSEDPLLSGIFAAAVTFGVQKEPGCGTTIKHFACNNRETERQGSESVVSERALREIYLKNFEIAVKTSQPMSLMSSYNLLNGIHTANNHDLLTDILRNEWGFKGFVMTDWTTTGQGGSSPILCVLSGNDVIMPGSYDDIQEIQDALAHDEDGTFRKQLKLNISRLANIIKSSAKTSAPYTESVSHQILMDASVIK